MTRHLWIAFLIFVAIAGTGLAQSPAPAEDANEVFSANDPRIEPARVVERAGFAEYSQKVIERGVGGDSRLLLVVDSTGRVERARVLKGLSPELDALAVEAVRDWKFEAATLDGEPVDAYYNLKLTVAPPEERAGSENSVAQEPGKFVPPRAIEKPTVPEYTEAARRRRINGTVILRATIGTDGKVGKVEVLEGLPHGLNGAAIKAVKGWKFEPATMDGEPVSADYTTHVTFSQTRNF